jgi:arylsulfatase A-like enzyme/Tfp pilus assembly protein PilF
VGAVVGLLLLGAAARWWLGRGPADTPAGLHRLWSERGVERPNVLLVTLDTTRADHLGCYGWTQARTPNLDALAGGGVLFAQAQAAAPLTLPAHSSIMTGTYPTFHGVRLNGNTSLSQEQTTLAEVLAGKGYQTAAFVGAFVLDGRWGLNQGFQLYDDHFDLGRYRHLDLAGVQRPADQVMNAALEWLEGHRQGPFFAWIHFYDAHSPYEPPEPFRSEFGARGPAGLYDGEIAFVDQQLGRGLAWLRDRGLADRTVVVVIGDHGEGLGSHGEGTHGFFVYDYALHVPFLISTPFAALQQRRVETQVSAVDVFPTVLALCGLEAAHPVQGRSLLPLMVRPRSTAPVYAYGESMTASLQFGWAPLQCLRSERYKLIKAPRPELYDLQSDPDETHDLYAQRPALAEELMQRLDRLVEETSRGAPAPESANLDKETLQRLAALGYVGAPVASRPSGPAPADPKDKLAVFAAVQQAAEQFSRDDYRAAAESLERALRDEPGMPQARVMLAGSYAELGRGQEARAQYDSVLKDDPRNVPALVGLANLLVDQGDSAAAIALCRRTLSIDERNSQAQAMLGEIYADEGQPAEALPFFQKAVEIQPKLTRNRLNLAGCLTELKDYDRAEALLKQIVRDEPNFPLAHFDLGVLYEEQGEPWQARTEYAAEIAAHPRQFKARFNFGKLLFSLGDHAGSQREMREVVRLAPQRPEGYLFLARGLLQEGASLDEVQPLVEKGLRLARAPELETLGWLLLADVFDRRRQPEKRDEALRKADRSMSAGSGAPHARHDR